VRELVGVDDRTDARDLIARGIERHDCDHSLPLAEVERVEQSWAAYVMSLKSGAGGQGRNAYPGGEISRWD
jgi:hypothetical protein